MQSNSLLTSFWITMPHITAQYLLADTIQASRGHAVEHGKSEQDRKKVKSNTPTPISTRSAIFDSPQKSSPSSSVSSTNPLAIVQQAHTPVAELEDTSLAYVCPELEDTSEYAIRSRGGRSLSSYTVKSTYPTVSYILNLFSGDDGPGQQLCDAPFKKTSCKQ